MSSRTRDTIPLAAVALAVVASAVVLLTRIAHAAQSATAPPPAAGVDWDFWSGLAVALAAFASLVLHAVAAKTHGAKWEKLASEIDVLRGLVPNSKLQMSVERPSSGSGTAAMLVVLLCGGAAVAMGPGCTSAERGAAATAVGHALINCTVQAIGTAPGLDLATLVAIANTAAAERAKCTPSGGALSWPCVEIDAIALGATLGGCAFVQLVAAAEKAVTPAASGLSQGSAAPPGRVELEDLRSKVGGVTWHTASSDY